MKNFKRVISAVIALALSASTLVAVSAANFADVDSTNANAEAIDVLAALDIIHGYEEEGGLVFKPEGEITRAEAAVMIVGALNMNADAKASAGATQFADVNEQTSWAQGYVNVGVSQGYIHGMDATTFAPNQNVTFAQMCVMLTTITGYGDYAAVNGGYPTGYMNMAATAGINKGVALAADTPLKRGQVAQMLYNAITAPMLDITTYKFDGNEYGKMDGIYSEKKTILSDKFNAVECRVLVDDLSTVGKVDVTMSDNNNYGPRGTVVAGCANWNLYKWTGITIDEGIDLSNYIKQEIKGIFVLDDNNKTHLVNVEGTNAITTKEIESADNYVSNLPTIRFGSTTETVQTPLSIYINGIPYTGAASNANIEKILKNSVGTIKLAKVPSGGVTPSNYNTLIVDAYQIAQVRNVTYESAKTVIGLGRIVTNNLDNFTEISITDNEIETGAVKLSVTLDGEAIELKDLQKNDIVAIKTKVTGQDTVNVTNGNTDISILVSREVVSGKVTEIDNQGNANKFVVGGTEYKAVDKTTDIDFKDYKAVYLDPFGRIASYNDEEVVESKNYGIAAKYEDEELTLVLADGSLKSYDVASGVTVGNTVYKAVGSGTAPTAAASHTAATATTGNSIQNCVVEYKLKNGKINSLTYIPAEAYVSSSGNATKAEYKAEISRIGQVGINSETKIIDVSESFDLAKYTNGLTTNSTYRKYTAIAPSQLADGEQYAGVAYGRGSGSIYSFVLITDTGYLFTANSRFAVLDANAYSQGLDADGEVVDQLKVVVNGKKDSTLNFKNTTDYSLSGHGRGDAFFYTIDSDGYAGDIKWITKSAIASSGNFNLTALLGSGNFNDVATSTKRWGSTYTGTEYVRLVKGIVVKDTGNKISLLATPSVTDAPVDATQYETFALADDCLIYTYNSKPSTASDYIDDTERVKANGVLSVSDFADWKISDVLPGDMSVAYTDSASTPVTHASAPLAAGYATTDAGKIAWTTTPVSTTLTTAEAWANARGIKVANAGSIKGKTTEQAAQYAVALIVDGQVVQIYQIIQ